MNTELDHHPINAARQVLATNPSDVMEFLKRLESRVTATRIHDNPEALEIVDKCENDIVKHFETGATLATDSGIRRWEIEWAESGWEVLIGHLYWDPTREGEFDKTSPLLLINRNGRARALYGAELLPLARRVIAHSLLSDAVWLESVR